MQSQNDHKSSMVEDLNQSRNTVKYIFNQQDHNDLLDISKKRDSILSLDIDDSIFNKVKSDSLLDLSLRESIPKRTYSSRKTNLIYESRKSLSHQGQQDVKNNKLLNNSSRISQKTRRQSIDNIENYSENLVYINKNYDNSTFPIKKTPKRLMAAIKLLVNVQAFYRKLSRNSRIFEKLSIDQFNLIGDNSTIYQVKSNCWQNQTIFKKLRIKLVQFFKFLTLKLPEIPKISPFSMKKRIWDLFQALFILSTSFLLSIFYFFKLDLNEFHTYLNICFYFFIFDIFISLNTGILEEEGNVVYNSKQIAKSYIKQKIFYDVFGFLPLSYFAFNSYSYTDNKYNWIVFILFFLKLHNFKEIISRMYFYFGFQKNMKPFIDLIKLIFLIVCVCHTFSLFWHGLAIYEIQIGRDDTWLHVYNLVDENIWNRYIYSFYYLAATMITVGYGDITPQNPIEISFTIITMFITAVFWAFFLSTIGNIIENIEQQDKLYNKNMEIIHKLMRNEQVNSDLRIQISNYLRYLYKVIFYQ